MGRGLESLEKAHLARLGLVVALALCTGCVTNGRRILLQEYGASVPALSGAPLTGITVTLEKFAGAPSLVELTIKGEPDEPRSFQFTALSPEEQSLWAHQTKALQKTAHDEKKSLPKIGNMRNAFGIVMSHVYALNDPLDWLHDSLKYDLEEQGAKVVDASQRSDADVQISGTVQLLRADMYFTVGATLVVDVDLRSKLGGPRHLQLHTHGSLISVFDTGEDYFNSFREARQKFSMLLTDEILREVKPKE